MSLTVAELKAVFTGDTKPLLASLATAEGATASRAARIGKAMTMGVTLPIVAAGAASVKMGVDFQTSMLRIHTQAGGTMRDVHSLSRQILALKDTQQSPQALADSMYHLKSVGLDNVKAMAALKSAIGLANISGADLEETTNAVAGAWRSGIKGAHNFKQAVATLNAIVGAGNMKMSDLNAAMSTGFLPAAKMFGLSLKDVGSALALMTDEGIPAQVAATRLRMSFSLLGAPSQQAAKYLAGIGLSSTRLAEDMRKPHGLLVAITDLKKHLDGLHNWSYVGTGNTSGLQASLEKQLKHLKKGTTEYGLVLNELGQAKAGFKYRGHFDLALQAQTLSRAFGGGQSSSAIMTMINNLSVLDRKEKQVYHTATTKRFGDAIKKQAASPQAQFKSLVSNVQTLAVQIGDDLIPAVIPLVRFLGRLASGFAHLSPFWQHTIVGVLGIIAAVGPLLLIIPKLVAGVRLVGGALMFLAGNPVGAIITVIALMVLGFIHAYKTSKTFRDVVNTAIHGVADVVKWLWDHVLRPYFKFIIDAWMAVAGAIVDGAAKAFGWVPGVGPKLKKAAAWFDDFKTRVNNALSGIQDPSVSVGVSVRGSSIAAALTKIRQAGQGHGNSSTGQARPTYAEGGYTGDGGKHQEAGIVHKGEYVMPAHRTRKLLPLLRALHHGRGLAGYADGGLVGTHGIVSTEHWFGRFVPRVNAATWSAAMGLGAALGQDLVAKMQQIKKAHQAALRHAAQMANPGGAGVMRWAHDVALALKANGIAPTQAHVAAWLRQIATESGGNPHQPQLIYDINTAEGHPAYGLLQTIPSTFNAYAFPGHHDIGNGFDNMLAAINYAKHRYGASGMFNVIGHGHGYDSGGWLMPGATMAVNKTGKPEAVLTSEQWKALTAHQGGPKVKVDMAVHPTPTMDEQTLADATADRLLGHLAALGVSV